MTASPISSMSTSVEMAGGSLADLNYGRASQSWPRWSRTDYRRSTIMMIW